MKKLFTALLTALLFLGCGKSNPVDSAQPRVEAKFHDIGGQWAGPTTLPGGQQINMDMAILHNNSAALVASGVCYTAGVVSGYFTANGTTTQENVVGGTMPDAIPQILLNINLTMYPAVTYALTATGSLTNDSTIVVTTACSYPRAAGTLTLHKRRT